jgi:hypothetical protein
VVARDSNRVAARDETRGSNSVALQYADCTTVGGELDFGESLADGAEEAFGELRGQVADAVRIGLEIGGGLVINGAESGLRVEVEGIVAREANLDEAFAALHGVEAGADKVTVEENIAGGGHQADVIQSGLQDLGIAADGFEVELAGALRADERAAGSANNDVAGNFLEVHVAGDAFQSHVAHDLLDVDKAGLRFELELGFFGNGQLKIDFGFVGLRFEVHDDGSDVDTVTGLFDVHADFVGGLRGGNDDFRVLRGLHFDAAVADVVNHDDGTPGHGIAFFDLFGCRGLRGTRGPNENARGQDQENTAAQHTETHVS